MRQSALFAIAVALGLAACDETGGAIAPSLTGTEWIAETINGKPVIEPGGVTLAFAADRVTGRSGCNRYFASARHANGNLKIEQVGATKMACLREGVMQQESEFINTLQAAQAYAIHEDGRLRLTTPAGGTLVFEGPPAR